MALFLVKHGDNLTLSSLYKDYMLCAFYKSKGKGKCIVVL